MHNRALPEAQRNRIVGEQVGRMLSSNRSFHALPPHLRSQILADTTKVVSAMADRTPARNADPYALSPHASALEDLPAGSTTTSSTNPSAVSPGFAPQGIHAGISEVSRITHEVNFPAFVASLIQGTFHAIVTSSIEQMKAYGELVKSVSQSLTDFRDQNVTENQAKDQLVSRYPSIFQVSINDGQPQVRTRDGFDTSGDLPDFKKDLGLDEDISELDEETIQTKLIPAARDSLARSRHQLLATMVLMGINRIIVTDGKINAKVQFQFSAKDQSKTKASHFDYQNFGTISVEGSSDSGYDNTFGEDEDAGSQYAKGSQKMSMPDVKITSQTNTDSTAALQASGALFGEVSINFRSESFPLERMADSNQIMKLQQAQRGAPTTPASPTTEPAPAMPGAPAPTTPAPAPRA